MAKQNKISEGNLPEKKETLIKQEEYMVRWVDTYFNTNFNGRMTSKFLKPHLTLESCEVDAARQLGNDRIKELIVIKREHIRMKENINLSFIISQLNNIIFELAQQSPVEYNADGNVINKKDYRAMLGALEQLTKIAGYNAPKKVDVTSGGEKISINFLD